MIFLAKDYATRKDLEDAIRYAIGDGQETNKKGTHKINFTEEDGKRLRISDKCVIYGVPCKLI